MSATKLITVTVTVAFLAAVAVIFWQQQQANRLRAEAMMLRDQLAQAASLEAENRRLAEQAATAAEKAQANVGELMRLRAKAGTLRDAELENARLKAAVERERANAAKAAPAAPAAAPAPTAEDPFDRNFGPGSKQRIETGKRWGLALRTYAASHQGQFPQTFEQAADSLPNDLSAAENAQIRQAADQFEILYQGLAADLDKLPPESNLILREKQPWQDSQGRWARTYVFADGSATILAPTDGKFDKWESIRIPKPNAKPNGQ